MLTRVMPVPLPVATVVVPLVIVTLTAPAPLSVTVIVSPAFESFTLTVLPETVNDAAGVGVVAGPWKLNSGEALKTRRVYNASKRGEMLAATASRLTIVSTLSRETTRVVERRMVGGAK